MMLATLRYSRIVIYYVYLMNVKLSYTMFTVSYICFICISVDSMEDLSCTELGNK